MIENKIAQQEQNVERNILDQVLRVMSLGAYVILFLSSVRIWIDGFAPKFGLMWAIALGILSLKYFGQRLPAKVIGYILFLLFSTMGFVALLNDGLASIGSIFLFLALSISSVVIGVRKLFLLIGLQFFALLLLILLISIDLVAPVPEQGIGYLLSPVTWLFHAVVIAIGAALSFYGSSKLGHWHRESLVNAKDNFYHAISILSLARDTETGEHIDRVSEYARILYEALQANSDHNLTFARDDIVRAACLHDVGKIAISDAILKKPGKLTEEEFKEMERHCEIGADIIATISKKGKISDPVLPIAENIARSHHENWNGSGYPNGLVATQIPLEARIMAIADVFDALRSKRPYKKPFSFEETLDIMSSMKGTKFDPKLFDIFLQVSDQFEKTFISLISHSGKK